MSFQFPANPADGDIVVRGNLLATYFKDKNTWEVGEIPTYPGVPGPTGPQGPKGTQGDPGSGVNVTAIVDTFGDLPVDPETGSFIIVDDTNTLYYWDGTKYYDLGSPIRGPKGDQGETGDSGASGLNGVDGRGWFGTAIDRANGEYKIVFQSNDGLEFITDDLKGGSWEPVYATADTPGLIKLGRGLDLTDEGELEQRDTYVQIETVPLGKEDNVSFSLNFVPAAVAFPDVVSNGGQAGWGSAAGKAQTFQVPVPKLSNAAIVYYFVASDCSPRVSQYWSGGGYWQPVHARIVANLTVAGAAWGDGLAIGAPMTHNLGANVSQTQMSSNLPTMKVGQIIYPPGTTSLQFTTTCTVTNSKACYINYGRGRVVVVPYLDASGQGDLQRKTKAETVGRNWLGALYDSIDTIADKDFYEPNPVPMPDEEITSSNAGDLKALISTVMSKIDLLTAQQYPSGSVYNYLMEQRQKLIDTRDLPGTYEQLYDYVGAISLDVQSYDTYTFRFE